jgi:hypothetical protein
MQTDTGKISLIQIGPKGERSAQIECSSGMIPHPGQYLQAHNLDDSMAALGWPLFPVRNPSSIEKTHDPAVNSLGLIPPTWHPGATLELRGPLGHGFDLPAVSHLVLVALGESASRLLPLIGPALARKADIVIFSAAPLPPLPAALEIQPLSALPEALSWADFLALDLPIEKLPTLRKTLGLGSPDYLPPPAQALITLPMPCAGIGECGACAVPLRRKGYALACETGPVFDLKHLDW